jgi:hypothetical protein
LLTYESGNLVNYRLEDKQWYATAIPACLFKNPLWWDIRKEITSLYLQAAGPELVKAIEQKNM